jgi:hypothetical protein
MRNIVSILCAIPILGCASGDSPTTPSYYAGPGLGDLVINLDISGDPSTGPSTYATTLDGATWNNLDPGENRRVVPAGTHTITLAYPAASSGFSSEYQQWCIASGPNRFSGPIPTNATTVVAFSLECPPLVGSGVLRLSYTVSGTGASTVMGVNLLRLNGPTLRSSVNVPSDKSIDVTLPVGLYRVSTNGSGLCVPSNTFAFLGMPIRAVRDGAVPVVNFPLTCK